ncbi:MAG: hypothetical protein GF320_21125 [Armatimonadia bacterium]|nr:hypothetical protein [Armatimonadia bacterium]
MPPIRPKVPPLFVGCLVLIVVLVCCSGIVRSCRKWMDGRAQASAEGETSETAAPAPPPVVEPDTVYGTPDQFARAPLMTNVRVVIENLRTGEPAKGRGTEALADPGARVHVLLQCRRGGEGGNTYYSNAPQAYWANTLIPADMLQPWPEDEFGPLNIRWYKVEPTEVSLSNRRGGTFSMAELEYVESPVLEWANEWTVPGDVTPVAHEPSLPGYGTMRYKVSVALANTQGEITKSLESTGKDAMLTVGISPEVPRLSLRPDDTFLGWLFAWGNVPYIFASASDRGERNTERHQTELFIGADGPDLIYGAMRKMGKNVRYSNTYGLENVTRTIYDSIDPAGPGVYESDGRRVQWSAEGVLPGDIVLWGEHAAVLLRDGPGRSEGELDVDDMVIHTHEAPPSQTTLARAWRTRRISILRPSFGG